MVKKTRYIILFFFILLCAESFADYNYKEDLSKQLNFYKLDIDRLYKRNEDVKILIKQYEAKLNRLNDSILIYYSYSDKSQSSNVSDPNIKYFSDEAKIIKMRESIERMKSGFLKRILWLYKHGNDYSTQILFSSSSFNDFYVKLEYLNKISEIRKKDFDKLKRELSVLEEKKKLSKLSRDEYARFLKEKNDSKKFLIEQKIQTENALSSFKDEIEMNSRQIEKKSGFIDKIERELFNYTVSTIYKIDPAITYKNLPIWEAKGKLIFPVQSVNIISDFGKSTNPETKSVSYNNGIDVSIAKGSEVRCVADGKVELITYIPYFGNIIIVNHEGNFRSIYANTKDVIVNSYQILRAGDLIARTSENNNGQCFHFELWKDNSPLDPKQWIKRGVNIN